MLQGSAVSVPEALTMGSRGWVPEAWFQLQMWGPVAY